MGTVNLVSAKRQKIDTRIIKENHKEFRTDSVRGLTDLHEENGGGEDQGDYSTFKDIVLKDIKHNSYRSLLKKFHTA